MQYTYKDHVLDRIRIGVRKALTNTELLNVDVRVLEDHIPDIVLLDIGGFLWGRKIDKKSVSYPENWWEAFKERWFPDWALKRWPVQRITWGLDVTAYYPTIQYDIPKHQAKLVITEFIGG